MILHEFSAPWLKLMWQFSCEDRRINILAVIACGIYGGVPPPSSFDREMVRGWIHIPGKHCRGTAITPVRARHTADGRGGGIAGCLFCGLSELPKARLPLPCRKRQPGPLAGLGVGCLSYIAADPSDTAPLFSGSALTSASCGCKYLSRWLQLLLLPHLCWVRALFSPHRVNALAGDEGIRRATKRRAIISSSLPDGPDRILHALGKDAGYL